MKRVCSMVSGAVAVIGLAAAIGLVAGCEWESSGDGNSWSDAFNWVNFSGTYRSSTSGILVSAYTQKTSTTVTTSTSTKANNSGNSSSSSNSSNSSSSQNNSSSETTDAVQTTTNTCSEAAGTLAAKHVVAGGTLKHRPIVPGTLVLRLGSDVVVSDNGSGALSGSGAKGTISYEGGGWSVELPDTLWSTSARAITANYAYTVTTRGPSGQSDSSDGRSSSSGSSSSSTSESSNGNNTTSTTTTVDDGKRAGSTGGAIYSLIVVQEGQNLTITDNNGGTYKGRIGTLRSSSGATPENSNSTSNGGKVLPKNGDTIVATFNCKGTSAAGMSATITGTLSGTVSTSSSTAPGVFLGRTMQGTWIEAGGKTGDINGTTDSIAIPKTEDATAQWSMLPSETRWPAGTEPGSSVITTPAATQAAGAASTSMSTSSSTLSSTQQESQNTASSSSN